MERQLGHLSLTAPTGNHVIESHSPCDCHLAYDRFPQNTPQSSVYINTIPKNLSRGHPSSITSHKVSLPARSSSQNRELSITRGQADARVKNYPDSGCIYIYAEKLQAASSSFENKFRDNKFLLASFDAYRRMSNPLKKSLARVKGRGTSLTK